VSNTQQPQALAHLWATFLELLPRIQTHGRIVFRHIRCVHRQADAIQEMQALAWKWLLRLAQRGKDVREFPAAFVTLLARAVHSGRRLVGMARAKDVMNRMTQRRHGFKVEPLPSSPRTSHESLYGDPHGQRTQDALEELLHDNTQTPIPDQVAFRQDFPAWRLTRSERDRRLVDDLMVGERTQDVAARYGLTQGRISQLRRDFLEDWSRFCGETAVA
jgi:hypothetical protein